MTSHVLFSIRRMLAMVAIVAVLCASLHYANPTTALLVQTGMLIVLVGFVILAIGGSPRARRFSIAALAAALIHLFLVNQNAAYDTGTPFVYPTTYACYWLWDRTKVATPMQNYPSVYSMPPSSPSTFVPPAYVVPQPTYAPTVQADSSDFPTSTDPFPAPPVYFGPRSAYPPTVSPDTPDLPPSNDPSFAPNLAPVENRPEDAPPPTGELTPQPAAPAWTESPDDARPVEYAPNISPSQLPPPNVVVSGVYPTPMTMAPMEYKPDFASFLQVGVLDVTLLLGIVAGSATLLLDDLRRRRMRGRLPGSRSQVS